MDPERLLDGLNDSQRRAVTTESAPLCILAGAGSGKTRVLTRRIAHRAATGVIDPRRALAITFTRKAAGELRRRLRQLGMRDEAATGTFHAVAYGQLKAHWAERRVDPPTLLERKASIVAPMVGRAGRGKALALLDVIGEIEWAKARRISPEHYAAEAARAGRNVALDSDTVASVYRRYEDEKRSRRMVDFDDLLSLARRAIERDEEFAAAQRWRIRHLFVDEFQDVNPLQKALLDAWLGDRHDLCVVGDPNQAIYGWNGADPWYLTRFEEHWPGAEIVRLVDNYRSSPQILAVANAVLAGSTSAREAGRARAQRNAPAPEALRANRPDGPVPVVSGHADAASEAQAVARAVRDHHLPGTPWNAQAVLVRTNAQITVIEEALGQAGIPYRVRGRAGLLEQPEVKDALAGLRRAKGELVQALADLDQLARQGDAAAPDELDERRANLEELVRLGHEYAALDAAPSIAGFLAWLSQIARADQPDRAGDAVELATFHGAKGLEWPVVHLAGLEQGLVPIGYAKTPAALAEERRLFYVAVTRAERELCCTWAEERTFGNRSSTRTPSPYLAQVHAAIDAIAAGAVPADWGRHLAGLDKARTANEGPRTSRARTRSAPAADLTLDERDQVLADALRSWRSEEAKKGNVPAYVVFNDRTLTAIAATRPASTDALLDVPGIGAVKAERYGDQILRIVGEHAAASPR